MVETLHSAIKGRARFRVKQLYRSESLKHHLEHRLGADPLVISARANVYSAGVLVHFDSGSEPDFIRSLIERTVSEFCLSSEPFPVESLRTVSLPNAGKSPSPAVPNNWAPCSPNQQPWHTIGIEAVVAGLESSAEAGISNETASQRLATYGPNSLPEPPRRSRLEILLNQLNSLPVFLLGAAAAISVVTGGLADAVAILAVVAINSAVGYATETEAEDTISSLKTLMHPSAVVIRDGARMRIDAGRLVPGDMMILEPGTYISADCRIIEAAQLRIDESSLTGESVSVLKDKDVIDRTELPLADRKNMVYMGTLVTGGAGHCIVIATGRHTEIGKLQAMIGETASPETPMERQLNTIGTQLVWLCGAICGVVFSVGIARGAALAMIAKTTISLAVAAVPEGLPAVATTTLAIGIRKLNAHRVVIRDLEAVETLGEVQTICFDKTGTVTENRMSVIRIFTGESSVEVRHGHFFHRGERIGRQKNLNIPELARICILCSEAVANGGEQVSSTEKALLEFAGFTGLDHAEVNERYPRIKTSFRTENRHFMTTLHDTEDGRKFLALKGNPLEVLAMCDSYLVDGLKLPLGEDEISKIEFENERMAGGALRVLGFACQTAPAEEELEEPAGLTWIGLIGMADPLRPGMKELIERFHLAGIDTIMLTGDQSATAYAIGKSLGLSRENPIEILDSTSLTDLDSRALTALAQRVHVFARVSPAHKLQIVQALQSAGRIVAMTGDGINDGPALKAANIGIAMGHSGTDVAREVADVVLEDDNLETMVMAVGHGRSIYNNIRKSLRFILSTNFSEIIVMFVAGAAGLGYPLSAIQLLWINLMSDIFPCLALALEPPEPGILERPPRDSKEPIIGRGDFKKIGVESGVISLAALGAYGVGVARYGIGQTASTMAFQSLTLGQLLHSLSCRSEKVSIYDKEKLPPNKYLTIALAGSLGLQLLTLVVPGLRSLLGIAPLSLFDGAVIGVGSIIPLLVNETIKVQSRPTETGPENDNGSPPELSVEGCCTLGE